MVAAVAEAAQKTIRTGEPVYLISVAVDDFGTGYSNLSYLIDFSFHKIKIDRSFVSRMDTDSNSRAVVSTIVGLSRALGVRTIARRGRDRKSGHPAASGRVLSFPGLPVRATSR